MASRPEDDRHVVLLHPPQRLADVVDVGDHEVHVMQPVRLAVAEAERMVQRIGKAAQECDGAVDAVRGAEVQLFQEKLLRRRMVLHAQHDVAQALDLGDRGRVRRARFGK